MSEIRHDPLHDDYVLIAPERLRRPAHFRRERPEPPEEACPFCPGHEALAPHEIFALREPGSAPDTPGWRTRVLPNLYKAGQIEAPWESHDHGLYESWEGFGAHEVIVDTPRHLLRMDAWKPEEYHDWLLTLRARLIDLRRDLRLVHFAFFKNHGPAAGATQPHPHTQLIALPVVPRRQLVRLRRAHAYWREHGHSLFDAILEQERGEERRLIGSRGSFLAFAPYASAHPFEVTILSGRLGATSLADLGEEEIGDLSSLLQESISALYRELGEFDFNLIFETPPTQRNYATEDFFDDLGACWRFHLRILPRLYGLAGLEMASPMRINPVPPEEAAALLRQKEAAE
jgi:UDPglucose--hexose-1-phosphate uridylyltransferase